MGDSVYFEGDPGTDSTRRHMERVLKGSPAPPRWPWMLAALGTGGVWLLWRLGRASAREKDTSAEKSLGDNRPGAPSQDQSHP